jgi:hypothetical protein
VKPDGVQKAAKVLLSAPEFQETSSIGSEGQVKKSSTPSAPIFEINLAPAVSKFTPVR